MQKQDFFLNNIEKIIEVSQEALKENVDRIFAVRNILKYAGNLFENGNEDYDFLIYLDSETEQFPNDESRKFFEEKYLETLDSQKKEFLRKLKPELDELFSKLIERFQKMKDNIKDAKEKELNEFWGL
jgi:hypothetical protein